MKTIPVISLYCLTCWQVFSGRTVDAAREGLIDHLEYVNHPGPLQAERLRMIAYARRAMTPKEATS